jgi:delta14-sterol reductase
MYIYIYVYICVCLSRYLVDYDPGLSVAALSGVVAVQLLGYYIFRSANSQKDAFRRDPEGESVSGIIA